MALRDVTLKFHPEGLLTGGPVLNRTLATFENNLNRSEDFSHSLQQALAGNFSQDAGQVFNVATGSADRASRKVLCVGSVALLAYSFGRYA